MTVESLYRHITSSVNTVKSESATKNSESIFNMFGLYAASFYSGNANNNVGDAQKEIQSTYAEIIEAVQYADGFTIDQVHVILFENGVERKPIVFGDPDHKANLYVTWASIYAFGDTEKLIIPRYTPTTSSSECTLWLKINTNFFTSVSTQI